MALNESKGNMYEFVTHTWNTVKGECPHKCSYCYMKRWGKQSLLHFDEKELKTNLRVGNYIFVGSSCDMFAEEVPDEWITSTLKKCAENPENKYFFQSKNPKKMISFLKDVSFNYSICTTIETNRIYKDIMNKCPTPLDRAVAMSRWNIKLNKYVTIEPIMDFDLTELVNIIRLCNPIQVNLGSDSGCNNLPEPTKEKVFQLIEELQKFTVIANKKNLNRLLN